MTRERREYQQWDGGSATSGALDDVRHWAVWGAGEPPQALADAQPGNDIARKIAEQHDEEWAAEHGWVVVHRAAEADVDLLVAEEDPVRGYAPYLMEAEAAGSQPEVMEERLRGDRVRRRPFDLGKRR